MMRRLGGNITRNLVAYFPKISWINPPGTAMILFMTLNILSKNDGGGVGSGVKGLVIAPVGDGNGVAGHQPSAGSGKRQRGLLITQGGIGTQVGLGVGGVRVGPG